MTVLRVLAAASVIVVASTSFAQPILDGQRDALYGPAKWLQTVQTSFGDNRADLCQAIGASVRVALDNSNVVGVDSSYGPSSGAGVTSGVEIAIPLSQLGNPAGPVRIAGYISGQNYNYFSNQVIGGLPPEQVTDLGFIGGVNFDTIPGNQNITVPNTAASNAGAVTVNGVLDAAYGPAIWTQTVSTSFGDSNIAFQGWANGSEIDAVHGKIALVSVDGQTTAPYLILFIAGNLESNYNKLVLWFDTGAAGGQNVVTTGNPAAEGLNFASGLHFDTGFAANYYMSVRVGGPAPTMYADFAKISPTKGGGTLSQTGATPPTAIVGAGSACPPDVAVSVGSEIDGVYSYLDRGTQRVYILITGNLAPDDYLTMFFDVNSNPTGDKGQNVVRGSGNAAGPGTRNVNIGISDTGPGSLNRCGFDGILPGLTFDSGFFADYYLNTHIEKRIRLVVDAAVMRTNGRTEDPLYFVPQDYGSFQGVDIPAAVTFDGINFNFDYPGGIMPQDGFIGDLYSHYAPRESSRVLQGFLAANLGVYAPSTGFDNTNPVWSDWLGATANGFPVAPSALRPRGGLIQARMDNSNVLGVTDASGANAGTATRGLELSISLEELGHSPANRIRIAGFLARQNFELVGNQVLGDPTGPTNLGDPRTINFASIAGSQYITLAACLADFNENGSLEVQDIFDFLTAWFAGNSKADTNGGGLAVQDIFDFLVQWFAGCQG